MILVYIRSRGRLEIAWHFWQCKKICTALTNNAAGFGSKKALVLRGEQSTLLHQRGSDGQPTMGKRGKGFQ